MYNMLRTKTYCPLYGVAGRPFWSVQESRGKHSGHRNFTIIKQCPLQRGVD